MNEKAGMDGNMPPPYVETGYAQGPAQPGMQPFPQGSAPPIQSDPYQTYPNVAIVAPVQPIGVVYASRPYFGDH